MLKAIEFDAFACLEEAVSHPYGRDLVAAPLSLRFGCKRGGHRGPSLQVVHQSPAIDKPAHNYVVQL